MRAELTSTQLRLIDEAATRLSMTLKHQILQENFFPCLLLVPCMMLVFAQRAMGYHVRHQQEPAHAQVSYATVTNHKRRPYDE